VLYLQYQGFGGDDVNILSVFHLMELLVIILFFLIHQLEL